MKHQKETKAALKEVVADNIWQTLNKFTSFTNRSATKETGVEAANWLKASFDAMVTESGRTDTQSFFIKTGWYKQPSLVTVIGKDINAPAVIIGAPMDTLDGTMPGADEGSGAATILESARVLLASKGTLKNPIYIIWYAAADKSFAGSQYVITYFEENSIKVKAVLQLDKTGYRADAKDSTMWVYNDHSDKDLSTFIAKLITTYIDVPVDYSSCGYGCSDHSAWNNENIPASLAREGKFEESEP